MKKILKGLICAGICSTFALTGLTGCGVASAHRDPESSPLRLAIGAVDFNFNPLFYTSANDGTIANLTQASLLTADENGELAYGENFPTVTLDYKETYFSDPEGTNVVDEGSTSGSTAYEFVIKNGVKFSDGTPLTVMDVLFNLYVYLDPLYSGSATIYSTKIQGLQAYRQQRLDADENEDLTQYYANANRRIDDLIRWCDEDGVTPTDEMKADLRTVKDLYHKELETDWNNLSTSWEDTYKDYRFTSAWQAFYFAEAIVNKQQYYNANNNLADRFYDVNDNGEKDDGEKYLTDFDPEFPRSAAINIDPATCGYDVSRLGTDLTNEINAAVTDQAINEFMAANSGYTYEDAKLKLQGDYAINYVYENRTGEKWGTPTDAMGTGVSYILSYCATAGKAFDEFVRDERTKGVPEGDLEIPRISGITVSRDDYFHGKRLDEEHDILKIMINGVDPKAKWNFSFAIVPMHYYSTAALTQAAMQDYADGKVYKGTATNFGVKYKNSDFMKELAASDKTSVPVGAGPYKCCSHNMNGEQVTGSNFYYNKMAYYERNENFTTLGSGIENAKIKYVTYKEMSDDKIVAALKANEIDYGTPIAKSANQKEVNTGNLKQTTYQTGGYGYVGINPKSEELRSVYVRQAIMYSFNTEPIVQYYGQELVSLINRPMSVTSWASPENPKNITDPSQKPKRYYEMTNDLLNGRSEEEFIRELVGKSGTYSYNEGTGRIEDFNGTQLKLTFTIAGESTDHPSYNMFIKSKQFLERCGFKIDVEHSALALQKLTTGDLQVWAAAWSSSIDPDPYQIYSLYSNASSTKNWYKTGIEEDGGSDSKNLAYEYKIAEALTAKIELGREQLKEADRTITYGKSSTTRKLSEAQSDAEFDNILNNLCCLDLIMEMAVEFPTYQRNELCVYNAAVLDDTTMRIADASFNMGPIDQLWKVGYRK